MLASFIYLAEPATESKQELIELEEPNLINGLQGFSDTEMLKFARAMEALKAPPHEPATDIGLINPFPGLRPFREEEEYLFFGRESQVDVMVDKLAARRFLAVVGTSGSGKSSLVNCGLRPALRRGVMASAGSAWRMAQFRPGGEPIKAMARALAEPGVLFTEPRLRRGSLEEMIEATLGMSNLGMVDLFEQAQLSGQANLLLIVDQFEELFRYSNCAGFRFLSGAEPNRRGDRCVRESAAGGRQIGTPDLCSADDALRLPGRLRALSRSSRSGE